MAKIKVSMSEIEPRNLRNFSVMWTGYEQSERKPGLHEINTLVLRVGQAWEAACPVAADMEVSVVKNPEAGAVEDTEGTVEAYMETGADSVASRATSKILEAVELLAEAAETDSRNTTNMTKELLLHQETGK
jgi:hypothetical protein